MIRSFAIILGLLALSASSALATPQCQALDRQAGAGGVLVDASTSSCRDSYTDFYGGTGYAQSNSTAVTVSGLPAGYVAQAGAQSAYQSYDNPSYGYDYAYGSHGYFAYVGSTDYSQPHPSVGESVWEGQASYNGLCAEGVSSYGALYLLAVGDANQGGASWGSGTALPQVACTSGDVQSTLP